MQQQTTNFLSNTLMYRNFHSNRSTFENVIEKIQRDPDFMKHVYTYNIVCI